MRCLLLNSIGLAVFMIRSIVGTKEHDNGKTHWFR
jgi:hypothetical protein